MLKVARERARAFNLIALCVHQAEACLNHTYVHSLHSLCAFFTRRLTLFSVEEWPARSRRASASTVRLASGEHSATSGDIRRQRLSSSSSSTDSDGDLKRCLRRASEAQLPQTVKRPSLAQRIQQRHSSGAAAMSLLVPSNASARRLSMPNTFAASAPGTPRADKVSVCWLHFTRRMPGNLMWSCVCVCVFYLVT